MVSGQGSVVEVIWKLAKHVSWQTDAHESQIDTDQATTGWEAACRLFMRSIQQGVENELKK